MDWFNISISKYFPIESPFNHGSVTVMSQQRNGMPGFGMLLMLLKRHDMLLTTIQSGAVEVTTAF
jgi:hypothetical protein